MAKIIENTPGRAEVLGASSPLRPISGSFKLGARDIPCALPPMLWRYRILQAQDASDDPDPWIVAAVCCAAIGVCWAGPDAPELSFAKHGRDVLAYGEAMFDWLIEHAVSLKDIQSAGKDLVNRLLESVPRPEAIEAAAVPTEATKAPSTAPSSPSESPGSETPSPATGSPAPSSST